MRPGLRRRRRIHRSTAMAGDPLDLFQHAMTNARGVIMFVMLMMALFGQASDAVVQVTVAVLDNAQRVRDLTAERDELQRKIAALPPSGDPELAARWRAALDRIAALEEQDFKVASDRRRAESQAAEAAVRLAEQRKAMEKLDTELAAKTPSAKAPSDFIRVSHFQQDTRKSVILTLNDGKLSRFRATPGAEKVVISPPTAGDRITDAASATDAVRRLLDGFQPTTHTVDLIVWQGSFRQAKLVEQAILDRGFDSNPLPVLAGTNIESDRKSKGGAQ